VAVYEYDGLNRRIKRHLDSESPDEPDGIDKYVHYFYNTAWQILETRDSNSENTGELGSGRIGVRPEWHFHFRSKGLRPRDASRCLRDPTMVFRTRYDRDTNTVT